jgi:1-acyl-sn-glycerol-3-phosphate acyltransferase
MVRTILSYAIWGLIGLLALIWLPFLAAIFALTAPFDPGRYAAGRWFRRAAVTAVKLIPFWDFHTEGVAIHDPRRPYLAVSNHESYADIFLISHLPWEMKWLAKEPLFRIPVMGWMMRMAGDIPVRRGQAKSRAQATAEVRDRLGKGVSVMIMPEGTRSPDGQLLPFRDGAFRIAVDTGTPILPIAVAGTRHAMAKDSMRFGRARAIARVLEPVPTEGLTQEDVPALRERVRSMIRDAREELLDRLGSDGRNT